MYSRAFCLLTEMRIETDAVNEGHQREVQLVSELY